MPKHKRRHFHEHYCSRLDHDHRWQCQRDPCLLGQNAFCQVCRCGRELMPRLMRDKAMIFECPMRHQELGHDARLIQEAPVSDPKTPVQSDTPLDK